MNTKMQGNVGVGFAIQYFVSNGYNVSIPMTESQRYDLVVDNGNGLLRVEVKTTASQKNCCSLRTIGGNKSGNGKISKISAKETDLVFCYSLVTKEGYLFPASVLDERSTVNLCDKYLTYKISLGP